jgi:PAS domain-containing protein
MRIRKRLQIGVVVSVLTAIAVCLFLFLALNRLSRANHSAKIAGELMTAMLERVTLRNDYIRNSSARAREQWATKHVEIGRLLKLASESFRDEGDRKNVAALIQDHESIGRIFAAIVENRGKGSLNPDTAGLSREMEDRLLSQLNMRVYEVVIHNRNLLESTRRARASAIRLAEGGIAFALMLLVAGAAGNAWSMGRSITARAARLREGATIIGGGNLGHRIDLSGDDEFAEIGEAFNSMTAKLAGSYWDLENEVAERKRAEESLRRAHDEMEERVRERTRELREASEAAKTERQRLYDVLETLPVYVVLLSEDYHVPFANRFFRGRFGESEGRRCYEYLFERNEPCEICETYSVMKTNAPHHWYWTGPDGRDYDIYDFPFVDSDGSRMILEMGIDITERNQAEKALTELNETLEERITERTAQLNSAIETLRASRIAALNLMEDAVVARREAEETNDRLRLEIAERKRAEEGLRESNEELTRFNSAVVGRELRMIELKQEVNALCTVAGEEPRYPLECEGEPGG